MTREKKNVRRTNKMPELLTTNISYPKILAKLNASIATLNRFVAIAKLIRRGIDCLRTGTNNKKKLEYRCTHKTIYDIVVANSVPYERVEEKSHSIFVRLNV